MSVVSFLRTLAGGEEASAEPGNSDRSSSVRSWGRFVV